MPETHDDNPDDTVRALLTAARPRVDTAALAGSSVALARDIAAAAPTPVRRRRRRVVVASVIGAVVLVPTTAAAYSWTAHTGIFGRPDLYTEDVDSSEILDLCAPDFPATARTLMPEDLPLPSGATRQDAYASVVHTLTRDCRNGEGVVMQATGVPSQAESWAWCSWVNDYLAEPADRAEAAAAFDHYANSEITHLVDADGAMTRWENGIADAAARGHVGRVRYEQRVNCDGGAYGWRP